MINGSTENVDLMQGFVFACPCIGLLSEVDPLTDTIVKATLVSLPFSAVPEGHARCRHSSYSRFLDSAHEKL